MPSTRSLFLFLLLLLTAGSAPAQDLVLSGVVVTPDKVLAKGWVVIKDGHILSISESAPGHTAGPAIDTNGIIFPGFVDLHNHPMYNIFKRWTPKNEIQEPV
jgi:5-methylthioadenosine/S-adenosylhomocysteine deaminase